MVNHHNMVNMWLIYVNILLIMVDDDGYYMVNNG